QVNALFDRLRAEVLAPDPCADHDVDRARAGKHAEGVIAAIDDRTEIAVFELVRLNEIDAGLADLVHRERQIHPVNLGAVEEAARVLRQAEDRGTAFRVVAADAFEETRS